MGYPHIPFNKKVEAVSYTLLGKSHREAANIANVKTTNLTNWARDPVVVDAAQKLIKLAKAEARAKRLLSQGWKRAKDGRMISPEGLKKLQEVGRRRAAQIHSMPEPERHAYMSKLSRARYAEKKASLPKPTTQKLPEALEGIKLPKGVSYKNGYVYTKSRRYTVESYAAMYRRNIANNMDVPPEVRKERASLARLAKALKRLEREEANAGPNS